MHLKLQKLVSNESNCALFTFYSILILFSSLIGYTTFSVWNKALHNTEFQWSNFYHKCGRWYCLGVTLNKLFTLFAALFQISSLKATFRIWRINYKIFSLIIDRVCNKCVCCTHPTAYSAHAAPARDRIFWREKVGQRSLYGSR